VTTFWLYVLGVVLFLIGLAISVGLHEFGHLIPAKLFGVRVRQYMIGFGPTVVSRKIGDTEYGLKAIPLGGFVSMAGMFPPGKQLRTPRTGVGRFFQKLITDARDASAETMRGTDESRAFYRLPVYKRIIVMAGGPVMNLVLAFVLLAIVVSGFGVAGATTTVASVAQCILPATSTQTECPTDAPLSPAAAAGLLPGDVVVSINGTPISEWSQATSLTRASAGTPLDYVVVRDGAEQTLTITPVATTRYDVNPDGTPALATDGTPKLVEVGIAGITPATGLVREPIAAVFPMMGTAIVQTGQLILNLPQKLVGVGEAAFGTAPRDINGPLSVVGVGRVAGEIASTDVAGPQEKFVALIGVLASLNIALFAFNLIPLLPLDGGHIAGALWEAIRRGWAKLTHRPDPGPVDVSRLMPLTFVVVAFMLGMSALLIYADLVKPITLLG
jgi:membrane-associated protease RseP (regulator of RpoE activity)